MRLGYIDITEGRTIRYMPKIVENRETLFSESKTEYIQRFFQEIKCLGRIEIVLLQGNKQRQIGLRGY